MANLKLDLLNKLRNEKYYKEMELVRLAQEPNMCYEEKIDLMVDLLDILNTLNGKMALMEQYFQEPEQPAQVPASTQPAPTQPAPTQPPAPVDAKPADAKPAEAPTAKVHKGQSHGE